MTLSETENEKRKSYFSKYPISINSVDIDKIIISNKVSFGKIGFKYSIRYGEKKKIIRPLTVIFPNMKMF